MKSEEGLGERRIIEIIQEHLDTMPKMPVPFGDDVSAYDIGNDDLAVLKTDMLVSKTDVPPGMSLWHAARKAVVMNVSDFAAKGVKPLVLLVSLGLPRGLTERDIGEIGDGLNAGAREYGAFVVGGDTGEASDLVISVSLFGMADRKDVMLRSGAEPGDLVGVTGFFGNSSAGLRILLNGFKVTTKMWDALVESILMPHARLKEGLALGQTKAVSAAIDSSDGLAWSLHEIARASNVGFLIDRLPVSGEAKSFARINKLNPFDLALYGGEEYELVVTVKPRLWSKAERTLAKVGGRLLLIGRVTAERQALMKIDAKTYVVEPRGYEHFR